MTKSHSEKRIALVVLTRAGLALALRLQQGLATHVSIYASSRAFPKNDARDDDSNQTTGTYGLPVGVGGMADVGRGPYALSGIGFLEKEADPRRDRGFARPSDPFPYEKPLSAPENLTEASFTRGALPTTPKKPIPERPYAAPQYRSVRENPPSGSTDRALSCQPSSPLNPFSVVAAGFTPASRTPSPPYSSSPPKPFHPYSRLPPPILDSPFLPERYCADPAIPITRFETLAPLLSQLWTTYDQIVLLFALGAVVRLIAPLLRHKHVDPGIVAIDDAGRFAISVVSGHIGDANGLALRCAELLGAIPVVTTASDVHSTLAVDLLAHTQGWQVEDPSPMTTVSAAIVNGEAVAILQTSGDLDWWKNTNPWPSNLLHVTNPQDVSATRFAALLVISDHLIEGLPQNVPTLLYRPPSLVLGIGCRRGISFDTLDTFVKGTLAAHQLAFQSIVTLATADIKADEAALQTLLQRYGWSFETHTATALRTMTEVPNPSQRVQHLVGTPSVCEAAALLSSNGGTLIVPKQKGEGMTLAVARK